MADVSATDCYAGQEQSVTLTKNKRFSERDTPEKVVHRRRMDIRTEAEISETAYRRLVELFEEIGLKEKDLVNYLEGKLAPYVGRTPDKKSRGVEAWFNRGSIPGGHIFNISTVVGIRAGYLAGQPGITKKDAIIPNEFYDFTRKVRSPTTPVPTPKPKLPRKQDNKNSPPPAKSA